MILICGDSTTPAFYPHLNLPAEPNGWMFKRMSITNFRCQVQLRGVNKGKVILAALIDPKTALPQSIVDFCLQRIVGYASRCCSSLSVIPPHPSSSSCFFRFYPSYLFSPCKLPAFGHILFTTDFCSLLARTFTHIHRVLLYLLLRTAERLNDAGDKLGGEYLEVVRSDPYYVEHCLPRILWYCQQRVRQK